MSTRRSTSPAFLTGEWRYLAMLNYRVDPALVRALTPAGTEPDTWRGDTYVSMVGFLFLDTRLLGLPVPFHRAFEEVNLRFYVRREAAGESRRGVVFVKEIVPRRAVAAVARLCYNENYVALPMRHAVDLDGVRLGSGGLVEYRWKHAGRWSLLGVRTRGEARALVAGSDAEFITEHYWGYSRQKDGGTVEYRVEHPRWAVHDVAEPSLDCDAAGLYGPAFGAALRAAPHSAFLAEGSAIIVHRPVRIA
jgi:uncharacterized protein YqjF (DUF2071 family)